MAEPIDPRAPTNGSLAEAGKARGRHGRVPSLNAWTDVLEEGTLLSSPPSGAPSAPQLPSSSPANSLTEQPRAASGLLLEGKGGNFHFDRLPEPKDPFRPLWRSPSPSSPQSRSALLLLMCRQATVPLLSI